MFMMWIGVGAVFVGSLGLRTALKGMAAASGGNESSARHGFQDGYAPD
jgi:hypothetical protein